jgi:hypothetical protein
MMNMTICTQPSGPTNRFSKQSGQSMVEYLIILPTLLMLTLGAIQFGLLYQIKSQVNYAAFAAARQGALSNGSATTIKDAFGAAMTPLFTNQPNFSGIMRGRAIGAIEAFNPLVTKIERISPPDSVKNDFGIQNPNDANSWIVPNDNLQYRPTTLGSSSSLNIQDANILKIRVTYCAKLIVPLANVAIYSLVNGIQGTKNLAGEFFSTPKNLATTPNSCSTLQDQYGATLDKVSDAAGVVGLDLGPIQSLLSTVSGALQNATVPGLNWVIGGYRIPVTSEAVVRMQTPMKFPK